MSTWPGLDENPLFCQAPHCADPATHRAVEHDGTALLICAAHAEYVESGNQEVRRSRQVTVKPLEGTG